MVETIISGIGLGIVLSFLTGPAFFALLKTSIEKGFYAGASFALGVLLSDIIYVSLAIFGSSFLSVEQKLLTPIGLVGSIILLGIGIYYLSIKVKINKKKTLCKKEHPTYILKGLAMCLFNPALFLYWISVAGGLLSVTGRFDLGKIVPFFASILITQFTLDCIKAFYADKLSNRIEEKMVSRINKFAGVLIILFALRLMYDIVFAHSLMIIK